MHLALLRGINVGGKAVLPMKELAAIFAEAGAPGCRTYIVLGDSAQVLHPQSFEKYGRKSRRELFLDEMELVVSLVGNGVSGAP